jgi:hypothetical protein
VEGRILRWTCVALLAIGTIVWKLGREEHGLPTADLHADAPYYYVYWPSLLHGNLDFTEPYRETHNWYHFGTTPTGRPANVFGIGPALFDAPVFALGHAAAWATGSRKDGFSTWEIRLYTWTSLAWTLGAILLAYRLVRRRLKLTTLSLVGPVVCALAGPIVYYAVRQPGYAHPFATFFAAWFMERWDASYDAKRTLRTWIALGALLGAAALARPQLALWGVVLVHSAIDDIRAERDARVALRWLAGAGAALVVFSPQLLAWKVLYGDFYIVPQGPDFMRWDEPCWSETLFSSRNGLFPWAPAYVAFAIALVAAVRRLPRLVLFLVLGIALQAIANGAAWDWWAGGSFGGRRFDSTYLAFALGASLIVEWIARVVPAALQRGALMRARAHAVAALAVAFVVLELAVANLHLVSDTTTTNVRMTGGVAASEVIGRSGLVSSRIAAVASSLSNLPVRAVFAWKHGVPLAAYDKLVGAHVLGETYPGLNAYSDQTSATIPGGTIPASGTLRLFVGLNRRGGVEITLPAGITATWNGDPFTGHTDDLNRGVNELELRGPPKTVVQPLPIRSTP